MTKAASTMTLYFLNSKIALSLFHSSVVFYPLLGPIPVSISTISSKQLPSSSPRCITTLNQRNNSQSSSFNMTEYIFHKITFFPLPSRTILSLFSFILKFFQIFFWIWKIQKINWPITLYIFLFHLTSWSFLLISFMVCPYPQTQNAGILQGSCSDLVFIYTMS